jgi:hypothetical protein
MIICIPLSIGLSGTLRTYEGSKVQVRLFISTDEMELGRTYCTIDAYDVITLGLWPFHMARQEH